MGWGSNPSGGEIFSISIDWLWDPTVFLYNGYWVITGLKWLEHGIDHLALSSAEVKTEYSCTSIPPVCCHGRLLENLRMDCYVLY
jgi:hypothetical protein